MVLPLLGPPAVSYTTVAATKRPVSSGLTTSWPLVDTSVPRSQHGNPSPAVKMVDDVPMGSAPTDAAGRTRRGGAHMALIDKLEAVAFVGPGGASAARERHRRSSWSHSCWRRSASPPPSPSPQGGGSPRPIRRSPRWRRRPARGGTDAHSPEARLHRRLGDAVAALQASPGLDEAGLFESGSPSSRRPSPSTSS